MSATPLAAPVPEDAGAARDGSPAWARALAALLVTLLITLLITLPALVALCFVPGLESAFLVPKAALFVILVAATVSFAAAAGLLGFPAEGGARRWLALSGVYCIALTAAWLASPRRDLGSHALLVMLAGPLLGYAALALLRGRERWMLTGMAAAGGAQAAISMAQWWLGFDPFALFGEAALAHGRMQMFGTLGNPDFVAIFVAASLPAALGLAFPQVNARDPYARWIWPAIAALDLAAILGTGCRTGLFAAGLGATVVLVARQLATPAGEVRSGVRNEARRIRGRSVLLAFLLLAATAAFVVSRNPRGLGVSARARWLLWQVALPAHSASFIGTGPGTFAYVYATRLGPFMRQQANQRRAMSLGYDRTANNDFLQALIETGIFGAAALLALLAAWLAAVIQMLPAAPAAVSAARQETQPAGAALGRPQVITPQVITPQIITPQIITPQIIAAALGGVAAICAAALFESPMQRVETWALLWLYMALPLAGFRTSARRPPRTAWRITAFAGAAAITLAAGVYAARPVQASNWVARGLRLEFSNNYLGAADAYRRALAYDDTNGSAWFNLTRTLAKQGQYAEAWQAAEGAGLRVHEEILWVLRVRLLEAMNQPAAALREAADGMERFPWSGELASDVVRLQGAAAAQNGGWPWGLQLGRPAHDPSR